MSASNVAAKLLDTKAATTGVVVVLIGAALLYLVKRYGAGVAAAVGSAVNPTDSNNLANRAVTGVGKAVSGDQNWTLGGSIFQWLHSSDTDPANLDGLTWSTALRRYTQVVNRETGDIFNVDAAGVLSPAN